MKIKAPWKCDYCPTVKGENNHWFMVNVANEALVAFILVPWSESVAGAEVDDKPAYEHICGSVCAGKALEKWLGQAST